MTQEIGTAHFRDDLMVTRRNFLKGTAMVPMVGLTSSDVLSAKVRPRPFVHLHVYSHYSQPHGACGIGELVEAAKSLSMNAVALTDQGNLFGAMEFYRAAKRAGIKPILGLELYVTSHLRVQGDDSSGTGQRGFPITLLAQNDAGFKNLMRFSTASCNRGSGRSCPFAVGKQMLKEHGEGLICLSGGMQSELHQALRKNRPDKAKLVAAWHQKVFGDRYYIEVQRIHRHGHDYEAEAICDFAKQMGIQAVATSDVCYISPDGFEALQVFNALAIGHPTPALHQRQQPKQESHLISADEIYQRFENHTQLVEQSQLIADSIDLDLECEPNRSIKAYATSNTIESTAEDISTHVARTRILVRPPPRSLVRMVCDLLGLQCEEADDVVNLIPEDFCGNLQEAGSTVEAIRTGCMQASRIQRIFELATAVDGKVTWLFPHRHRVLVGRKPLMEYVPLAIKDGYVFAQWDVNDIPAKTELQIAVMPSRSP